MECPHHAGNIQTLPAVVKSFEIGLPEIRSHTGPAKVRLQSCLFHFSRKEQEPQHRLDSWNEQGKSRA